MSAASIAPEPGRVLVLMYHSISDGPGPTCIAPDAFRRQMTILEDTGYRVVPLLDVAGWLQDGHELPRRCAALTFDDGFEDFATVAFPELSWRGWPATVFVPSGRVGGFDGWDPPGSAGHRRLMDWATIAELAGHGVDFGGHGVTHRDLSLIRGPALEAEVRGSKRAIEEWTGRAVTSFAAPYGRSDDEVIAAIRRHYQIAVGTRLARAGRDDDPYDVPRIEMWYFREARRWRAFLQGRAEGFFLARRLLRRGRQLAAAIAPVRCAGPVSVPSNPT